MPKVGSKTSIRHYATAFRVRGRQQYRGSQAHPRLPPQGLHKNQKHTCLLLIVLLPITRLVCMPRAIRPPASILIDPARSRKRTDVELPGVKRSPSTRIHDS
ncbi:hypothetical protein LX36DRAFT_278053 [Colletotrichum falcatum]|nr:hypothetical protein LX36DRAFT_278053 [Colletotrichum falcatum]